MRLLTPFALLASAAALAQTVPQAAPAPGVPAQQATTPSAPRPAPAETNARAHAVLPADEAAMKAHVLFLASDALRGREAGTPEFDVAAQYVAAQFFAAGLRPGGDEGGYLQRVPLIAYSMDGDGSAGWTPITGGATPLARDVDFAVAANPARAETRVSAPVVFVGQGIVAPQYGQDDYRGVDVRGKIVAYFAGAPARFGGEERAFFGSPDTKARFAEEHGAVGVVAIEAPGGGSRSFAATVRNGAKPRVTWANPDGTGHGAAPGAPVLGTLSLAGAAKLFAGAATPWAKVLATARGSDPRFTAQPLAGTLAVASRTRFTPTPSSNVIGVIPGGDPALKDQVVVLSAHLDHIGVGEPVNGDAINNGALDNAIGIASLIEEAKRFTASGKPPRRTVMFLAVTAEEKGLVGADYFARHPTVPIGNIVADVNLDMPVLTYVFEDMTVFGAERSTLGPIVRKAAESVGVGLTPDPNPEQGFFVRSDHFRFVEQGVPSVFLWPGQKGPGKAAFTGFLERCYHKPCDDLALPILWDQGPRFVGVNYAIAREIADRDERPVWNKGDYFGTRYKGPMAR